MADDALDEHVPRTRRVPPELRRVLPSRRPKGWRALAVALLVCRACAVLIVEIRPKDSGLSDQLRRAVASVARRALDHIIGVLVKLTR